MVSITDLEMAGCELNNSGVTAPDVCPSTPIIPYKMTTMADLGRDDSKNQKVADHPIDKMNEAEKDGPLEAQYSESTKLHSAIHQKASLDINLQNGSTQEHHHRWRLRTLRTAYRHDGSEKICLAVYLKTI